MDRSGADVENGHTHGSIMVRQPPFRTRNTTTTRLKYQKRELDSRMIILILLIITIGYSSKK